MYKGKSNDCYGTKCKEKFTNFKIY
jgi:hypothetical protein